MLSGCNSTDSERFNNQVEDYVFSSTTSVLIAYGASQIQNDSVSAFRCPSVSRMRSEANLAVFYAQANGPAPHFTLDTVNGIRGDSNGGFGISIKDLPIGMLDIFERCHSSSSERLVTACPESQRVESCSDASEGLRECVQIYTGTHKLVAFSTVTDSTECISEAIDRTPYSSSVSEMSYACDAFDPIEIPAAIRGSAPSNYCCDASESTNLEFCLKPCGCRTLNIAIVPKEESVFEYGTQQPTSISDSDNPPSIEDVVRIAVVSNIEGHTSRFEDFISSVMSYGENIDAIVNLGNLTEDGDRKDYEKYKSLIHDAMYYVDGELSDSGFINTTCTKSDSGRICCDEKNTSDAGVLTTDGSGRIFTSMCNVVIGKVAFLTGLGEDEVGGSLDAFRSNFGPSNFVTNIGKVQLIMLDTAEATVSEVEQDWLKDMLDTERTARCNIPAPTLFDEWPLLADCHNILGKGSSETVTCRECIQQEAYCIPPDSSMADTSLGPENCVCVPITSKVCPGNLSCGVMDGVEHDCVCTRDEDCGMGGTCTDGKCEAPIKLVFSYTPLFDKSGARNNAFVSKNEAADLLSMFIKYGVNAVFSGRVRDYQSFNMGGIPMYITGGGGAKMASFASHSHHWLLVEIPNAYTHPDPSKISVTVKEF